MGGWFKYASRATSILSLKDKQTSIYRFIFGIHIRSCPTADGLGLQDGTAGVLPVLACIMSAMWGHVWQ